MTTLALEWQARFGVAPHITSAVSEYDAAILIGMTEEQYAAAMTGRSAVGRGFDFTFDGQRCQVKANRPSGLKGSFVTLVGKADNLEWDHLIWILYSRSYLVLEAWIWDREAYADQIMPLKRLSPAHMRQSRPLFKCSGES